MSLSRFISRRRVQVSGSRAEVVIGNEDLLAKSLFASMYLPPNISQFLSDFAAIDFPRRPLLRKHEGQQILIDGFRVIILHLGDFSQLFSGKRTGTDRVALLKILGGGFVSFWDFSIWPLKTIERRAKPICWLCQSFTDTRADFSSGVAFSMRSRTRVA